MQLNAAKLYSPRHRIVAATAASAPFHCCGVCVALRRSLPTKVYSATLPRLAPRAFDGMAAFLTRSGRGDAPASAARGFSRVSYNGDFADPSLTVTRLQTNGKSRHSGDAGGSLGKLSSPSQPRSSRAQ